MSLSKSTQESELSSVELRSKLFHTFKSKGVLQSVKSQLRNRLVLELQSNYGVKGKEKSTSVEHNSLFLQATNGLFLEHLKRCSYDYTLSVFTTESLTDPEKIFSIADVLHLLQINPESKLYRDLVELHGQSSAIDQSFLYRFLHLLSNSKRDPTKESTTQTDNLEGSTLDAKLQQVELVMKSKKEDEKSLEEKLLKYQRKYEAQKKTELQVEIERFKSTQLSLVKIEEKEKYQKEIEKIRNQYDDNFQKRLKEIERKEKELEKRSSKQKQTLETEAYEHRQKLLSDLQQLKDREIQMERNQNITMRTIEMEEEKLKSKKDQLKYKEEALKEMEKRYEERLQNEIIKVKYDIQQEERNYTANIRNQEQQLREDKVNFEAQKNVYMQWKSEAEKLKEQSDQQHMAFLTAKQKIASLNQKIEFMNEKYRKMENYDEVVDLNRVLEKDIALLQRNFDNLNMEKAQREKEHQKLVQELLDKISRATELEMVQAKDKENKERYFREKYYSMQDKYQIEVSKNEDLKKMNEDLLLSQKETLREVEELRTALQIATQEKEKFARLYSTRKTNVLPVSAPSNTVKSSKKFITPLNQEPWANVQENVGNEGNEILLKLEREAKELEQSYKAFQERQKQAQHQYKSSSSSRVHFNPLISHRSNSTFETTDNVTRTLEMRASDESIKYLNQFDATKMKLQSVSLGQSTILSTTSSSMTANQRPLSSTQTPGDSGASALSFGISRVTRSNINQDTTVARSANNPALLSSGSLYQQQHNSLPEQSVAVTAPSALATCYSLTQIPLGEITTHVSSPPQNNNTQTQGIIGSPTQYPLYETTRATLTQYPMLESGLNSKKASEVEKNEIINKTGTGTQSIQPPPQRMMLLSDFDDGVPTSRNKTKNTDDIYRNPTEINQTNSVEHDYGLKETSISTFESPVKEPIDEHAMVEQKHQITTSDASARREMPDGTGRKFDNSISSKDGDGGSLKSSDLKSEATISNRSELSEINELRRRSPDNTEKSNHDAEIQDNTPGEEKAKSEDVMAKYMQMILEKKQASGNGTRQKSIENSLEKNDNNILDDIPQTSTEEDEKISEPTSSEYEW